MVNYWLFRTRWCSTCFTWHYHEKKKLSKSVHMRTITLINNKNWLLVFWFESLKSVLVQTIHDTIKSFDIFDWKQPWVLCGYLHCLSRRSFSSQCAENVQFDMYKLNSHSLHHNPTPLKNHIWCMLLQIDYEEEILINTRDLYVHRWKYIFLLSRWMYIKQVNSFQKKLCDGCWTTGTYGIFYSLTPPHPTKALEFRFLSPLDHFISLLTNTLHIKA